jgi:transposase-like protein
MNINGIKLHCAIEKSVQEANYSQTASHASEPAKRKRERRVSRPMTPEEKLQAILRVRNGEPKAVVGRSIGVPESTLRGWCKSESKIRDQVQKHASQAGLSFVDNAIPSTSSASNLPHNIVLPVMDTSNEESDDVVPAKKARMEHSATSTATNHSVITAALNEINNRIRMEHLFQNSSQYENLMIESCMYTLDRIMPGWQRQCAVILMSNLHSMLALSQNNE